MSLTNAAGASTVTRGVMAASRVSEFLLSDRSPFFIPERFRSFCLNRIKSNERISSSGHKWILFSPQLTRAYSLKLNICRAEHQWIAEGESGRIQQNLFIIYSFGTRITDV